MPRPGRRRTLHPDQRALPIPELAGAGAIYACSFILTSLDVTAPGHGGRRSPPASSKEHAATYLIGDRLDITGARWGLQGAEAILTLRAVIANGDYWRTTWPANSSGSTPAQPKASTHSVPDPLTPNEPHPIPSC